MPIMAKGGGNGGYEAPPVGVHASLCVDVIDLGVVKTPFKDERTGKDKMAHQIAIVYQVHPLDEAGELITRADGGSFRISKFYTLSLNEKANLRKDLEAWRGKPFSDEDLTDGFDVERLIGVQCQLTIVEVAKKGGGTRTQISGISPKHRADPIIEADESFIREMNRPGGRDTRSPADDGSNQSEKQGTTPFDEDEGDDLPF